ncbi:uncharacterized protein At5g08430 [Primulina tabacum]|uniref:uncharacterized protein At5g08430 n=1 Tax=Primulina tabacum TaxID=48773 RepID=UPI003F594428
MKDTFWLEEYSGKPLLSLKRKRRVGKKRIEFIGWGSRPLLEFLGTIGEDTVKKFSQREVSEFVTKYVHDKSLVKKNKRVECDEILRALFGRPSVSRTKIYDLLEEHFAENLDESDDDLLCSSEEENYKEKSSKSNFNGHKKKDFESPKSCFAAIIPENIKLIYLKRTLVQEFLKVPESFECKIVGSFVRMKSDPNYNYQKNRFQLQQVTGVKMLSGASDAGIETCLQVSNHFKDVPICMLSDDNFSEEEMEDLRDRIKADLFKKMNVVEFNLKAKMLHEDITKHWIAKEISLLQKLIDHANEKGRRKELFELLERRKQLQKPSEREKLLATIPEVIAEELVPDETVAVSSEKAERNSCSPNSALVVSDVSSADASGFVNLINRSQVILNDLTAIREKDVRAFDIIPVEAPNGDTNAQGAFKQAEEMSFEDLATPSEVTLKDLNVAADKDGMGVNCAIPFEALNRDKSFCETSKQVEETTAPTEVIELSDDESEPETNETVSESSDNAVWHYLDPQGEIQGPFSLNILKVWSEYNYFHSGFEVWKTGQSQNEGVLLVDVLRQTFPS